MENGITTLNFLLARNVSFVKPVDDAWYSAHQPGSPTKLASTHEDIPAYYADHTVNVLGCIMRRQICNPVSGHCSPLSYDLPPSITWSSQEQQKNFNFWWAAPWITTLQVPHFLGVNSLQAFSNSITGVQGPLPPDQWQQEVISWQSIALAHSQRMIVEAVIGPSDTSMQHFTTKETADVGDFCINQKVRSTAYICFSVLGLTITLVLGGLIIIVSSLIEPLYTYLDRRRQKHRYRRLEWVTNETLQLQRMVYEELDLGTWSGASSHIPVTEKNEQLGVLDVSDERHPYMVRPTLSGSSERKGIESQSLANATSSSLLDQGASEDAPDMDALLENGLASAEFNVPEAEPDRYGGTRSPSESLPTPMGLHPIVQTTDDEEQTIDRGEQTVDGRETPASTAATASGRVDRPPADQPNSMI